MHCINEGCQQHSLLNTFFNIMKSLYVAPLYVGDDISSLRNFICILITFWSSQGSLSSKKSRKTEESTKKKNVSRFA